MLTAEYETKDGLKIEITDSKITFSKEGHSIDVRVDDFYFTHNRLCKLQAAVASFGLNDCPREYLNKRLEEIGL